MLVISLQGHRARRNEDELAAVRIWLPLAIAVAGLVLLVVGGDAGGAPASF